MKRTINTLFILSSIDGKISTGNATKRDFDKDLPKIKGAKEGLNQYYNLEQKTDLHSLNTGKVMSKIGINSKMKIKKLPVSFIIIDNSNLKKRGVENLIKKCKKLYIVTKNKSHPAFKFKEELEIIYYSQKIDFPDLFKKMKNNYENYNFYS